jgi:hypothetical protein
MIRVFVTDSMLFPVIEVTGYLTGLNIKLRVLSISSYRKIGFKL